MTQTVTDFPIGTLVRKGNGTQVYRVYQVSETQVAVCKVETVKDPSRGGWISPRRLVKVTPNGVGYQDVRH
jgi:hypothetical protein